MPLRRPRAAIMLLGALAFLLLVGGCQASRAGIYPYNWGIFWDSLLRPSPRIVNGIWLTVSIAITSQIIGVILGVFGALGRLAKFWPARIAANIYVWIFRGTPLLVQITFLYYGLLVTRIYGWPDITVLGITLPSAIQAGIFALGVNEGAYMTEIVRLFLACACWFLLLTTIWSIIQAFIERCVGRGYGGERPPGIFDRLFGARLRRAFDPSQVSGGR